jgi:galactokinase
MTQALSNEALTQQFYSQFGQADEPLHHYYSPGRVNLIGEYTDFNGGLVLPCGIERGIHLLIRKTAARTAQLASGNLPHTATIDLTKALVKDGKHWTNYPLGVMHEFTALGCQLQGMQLYFYGDVPDGAGLSSSAAIEVVTAFALNQLHNMQLPTTELALLSQRAEHNFNGVQCGIMDQFAVAMASADHAISLQCNTLQYEQVPLELGDYQLLIGNTGQRRELADAAYNQRVIECNQALALLQPATGATELADVSPQQLQQHLTLLRDPIIKKRATHVIEENHRVKLATDKLRNNDLAGFGQLMNESHQSLRDNFQVSSSALDTMVEMISATDGVLGSRMTGAGFGGCTVTLIHRDVVDDMIQAITPGYIESTGYQPEFYSTRAAAGVRELTS